MECKLSYFCAPEYLYVPIIYVAAALETSVNQFVFFLSVKFEDFWECIQKRKACVSSGFVDLCLVLKQNFCMPMVLLSSARTTINKL